MKKMQDFEFQYIYRCQRNLLHLCLLIEPVTLLMTPCPVSLPVTPDAPLSHWELEELNEEHGKGPLGSKLGFTRALRASWDMSSSISNQIDSRTHLIPAAKLNNVPLSKAGDFQEKSLFHKKSDMANKMDLAE